MKKFSRHVSAPTVGKTLRVALIAALLLTSPSPAFAAPPDVSVTTTVSGQVCGNGNPRGNVKSGNCNSPTSDFSDRTVEVTGAGGAASVQGAESNGLAPTNNNTVTINTSGTITGGVLGGNDTSQSGATVTANDNKVIINSGTILNGLVIAGHADTNNGHSVTASATATGNIVTITGGTMGSVSGGEADVGTGPGNGTANDNRVTITGGTVAGEVHGGNAGSNGGTSTATGNIVTITGGTVTGAVVGGYLSMAGGTSGIASGNIVTITGGTLTSVIGGGASASSGSTIYTINNTVTISGNPAIGDVYGGGGDLSAAVYDYFTGNTLNKNSAAAISSVAFFETINFNYSGSANITTLNVHVYRTTPSPTDVVKLNVIGSNVIDFDGVITGGSTLDINSGAGSTGTLNLTGVNTFAGVTNVVAGTLNLIGAGASLGSSNINVYSGAEFGLYGGTVKGDVDLAGGSVFSVRAAGQPASIGGNLTVAAGSHLNFYIGGITGSGQTILDLPHTSAVDISGSTVGFGFKDKNSNFPLVAGDHIILIDAAAGTLFGTLTNANATATTAFKHYEFELDAGVTNPSQLQARLKLVSNNQGAQTLSKSYHAGATFLAQGSEFLAMQGIRAAQEQQRGKLHPFVTIGGGRLRYESDSHVDVKGYNLLAGLASAKELNQNNTLTLGLFFEYGRGDYDSRNNFVSSRTVHASGDTHYYGIGGLFRNDTRNGLYVEGSARAGKTYTDYQSYELIPGIRSSYDARNNYLGAHLGLGKLTNLNEKNLLDIYIRALWTGQRANSATLHNSDGSTEKLDFDRVSSERLQLGTRYTHRFLENFSAYAGLAYDYEFNSKVRHTKDGEEIHSPHSRGGTGIFEIGLTGSPSAGSPLFLNLGVQGYAGKREGVTGSLRMKYFF
ncbi:MAG: hypothetical protein LBU45_02790 [Azoarcus sp.]|nr:hypothetical protein [Azoarcus sp.]